MLCSVFDTSYFRLIWGLKSLIDVSLILLYLKIQQTSEWSTQTLCKRKTPFFLTLPKTSPRLKSCSSASPLLCLQPLPPTCHCFTNTSLSSLFTGREIRSISEDEVRKGSKLPNLLVQAIVISVIFFFSFKIAMHPCFLVPSSPVSLLFSNTLLANTH